MADKADTLRCTTILDLDPDRVLQGAVGRLDCAVVVGRDERGELYLASSYGSVAETAWLLENARHFLLELK